MTVIEKVAPNRARELLRGLPISKADEKGMEFCYTMSTAIWVGYIDEQIACIWGLIPPTFLSGQAYLWFLTTDVIKEHQFILVRHSQLVMEKMLEAYPSIVGHATVGDKKAIRWLKWLGAEFGYPQGTGVPFRINKHG
jgi:hypothetical protein